jgi:hypothetical protein
MPGPLFCFLAGDHARLDGLLRRAMTKASMIDRAAYAEFRAGLLKHISLEEKILLPAAQRWQGGDPLPMAAAIACVMEIWEKEFQAFANADYSDWRKRNSAYFWMTGVRTYRIY